MPLTHSTIVIDTLKPHPLGTLESSVNNSILFNHQDNIATTLRRRIRIVDVSELHINLSICSLR